MRIGLIGGSFDPLHNGHLKLAAAAEKELKLSRVYFVPNPQSPFKTKQNPAPMMVRLRLMRLALRGRPGWKIGRWEIGSRRPAYTVSTLARVKRSHPKDELFFIMGSDAWSTFSRWKSPLKIARMATLVVGLRPPQRSIRVSSTLKPRVHLLNGSFPKISSTEIKRRLKSNPQTLKSVLPRGVLTRIKKEPAYG